MEAPFEKLVIKLWETIADKGIGSLLKPWQMRREGQATIDVKRQELLMLAQVEAEVAELKYQNTSQTIELLPAPDKQTTAYLQLQSSDNLQVMQHAEAVAMRNLKADAIRKEIALAKAVLHAEDELKSDPSPAPDTTVSDDWLLRWRDYASGVSSDELQSIWGKVLAGEVKSPGRYSLRTLEFLKNLNQDDAKSIEKIAPVVVMDRIFQTVKSKKVLSALGFTYTYFLQLQDIGLISGVESNGLHSTFATQSLDNYQLALTAKNKVVYVIDNDSTKKLNLPCYLLTTLGKQVMQLITCTAEVSVISGIAESIKTMGYDKVQVGDYSHDSLNNQILMFNLTDI